MDIIKCNECKYWSKNKMIKNLDDYKEICKKLNMPCDNAQDYINHKKCIYLSIYTSPLDYCSKAERK